MGDAFSIGRTAASNVITRMKQRACADPRLKQDLEIFKAQFGDLELRSSIAGDSGDV